MEHAAMVELRGISKHFGTVRANHNVDLTAYAGEIHAILGENGSGKSTLMNILTGLYAPDSGEIRLNGAPAPISSPKDAIEKGIGMIHQHYKQVEALTAWENIVGGTDTGLFLSRKKTVRAISELCLRYGMQVDPGKRISDMSIGEKQNVEIVKALYRGADILILDEPTAVLTVQETDRLFRILREMRSNGRTVIIITHKLNEVMAVSDRVTVLRRGENVMTCLTAETNAEELACRMVGHHVDITVPFAAPEDERKKAVLRVRDLAVAGKGGVKALDVKELDVHACEIVGIAGVADSGQKELCEALTGLRRASGSAMFHDTELIGMTPGEMIRKGVNIGFIPEDRLGMGLAGDLSVADNAILRTYRVGRGVVVDMKSGRRQAEQLVRDYGVSTPGIDVPVRMLSGGNIQKILLGREISQGADLLIAAYPVRGLDIGAMDYIYEKLNEQKQKGVAVLLVAEDIDVLLGLCDRVAVLCGGRLMDTVDARTATRRDIGLLMTGIKPGEREYAAD